MAVRPPYPYASRSTAPVCIASRQVGAREHRLHGGGKPLGPLALSLQGANEILTHLDDGVRQPAPRAVLPHAVAGELAVVRLVLADDDAVVGAQRFEQGNGEAIVAIPQDRCVPRSRHVLPAVGEAVDRQQHRRHAGGDATLDQAIDAQVIGFVVLPHAPLALGAVEMTVARHHRAVGDAHDERRIVEAAIGIDQQTREARENRGRVQHLGDAPRHCRGADIVGDMALELVGRQPECSVLARNCVNGVIAHQQQAGVAPAGDHFVTVRDEGGDERGCLAPIEIWHAPNIALRPLDDHHPRRRAA